MGKHLKSILVVLFIFLLVIFIVDKLVIQPAPTKQLAYSVFYDKVVENQVKDVKLAGTEITGTDVNSEKFVTTAPSGQDPTLIPTLRAHHVTFAAEATNNNPFLGIAVQLVPFILVALVLVFILRQAQSGGSQAMSFGRSRAKLMSENRPKVTFADVAGASKKRKKSWARSSSSSSIRRNSRRSARAFPRACCSWARRVRARRCSRARSPVKRACRSSRSRVPTFVEMFVGVGASRVRDLFEQAKKSAPCIVFIDEIDAVGRQRGAGLGGGHDEREQTLNQLLVEMDGFDQNTGVILIAATNRPDVLDPALLRPGRFDRQIVVDRADVKGRAAILAVHSKNKPLSKEISLDTLAKRTPGFSGADLENLLNEAALLAARRNKSVIEMAECEEAIDRVLVGPERKSLVMSQREKENTAFHESGHAVVGGLTPNSDPVHKVTIIPRGMALGLTWSLPDEDRHSQTKNELFAIIKRMLAGRIAEEIKFGDVTTGASDDFAKATEIARRMVTQYGMSDSLGPIQYGRGNHQVFLGRDFGEDRNYSEEVAFKIDTEVRKIIDDCYSDARKILEVNWDKVERMVASLLEHETVETEEVLAIMNDTPWPPPAKELPPEELPIAAKTADPEPVREKPKRLPPNITPEPA